MEDCCIMDNIPEPDPSQGDRINLQDANVTSISNDTSTEENSSRKVQFHSEIPKVEHKKVFSYNSKTIRRKHRGRIDGLKCCPQCKRPSLRERKSRMELFCSSDARPERASTDSQEKNHTRTKSSPAEMGDHTDEENTSPPGRSYQKFLPIPPEDSQKCHICLYRRSIEIWKPLMGEIYCPKCHFSDTPLLRTKIKTKTSYFTFGSNFIKHCWPLCFIPYLFPPSSENFLHCAECFNFLGMYDERDKCVHPNREYIEFDGCFSAEETRRREQMKTQESWKKHLSA